MSIKNKVVIRKQDGGMVKGYTLDFTPVKDVFHVVDPQDESKITKVSATEPKAVFFVKSFEGNRNREGPPDFSEASLKGIPGLKLKVTFLDGEVMYGTTNGYAPKRKGFFVFPVDKASNNERVYVFSAATKSVETWR